MTGKSDSTNSAVSAAMTAQSEWIRALVEIVSSSSGSATGLAASQPFDTAKTRAQFAQTSGTVTPSTSVVFREIVRTEGFTGLWRGMATPLMATSGFCAVLFFTYMHSKRFIHYCVPSLRMREDPATHSYAQTPRLSEFGCFVAGASTGFVSSFLQSPSDLAKTKMQAQSMRGKAISGEPFYQGSIHCLKVIAKSHGIRGIMQGQVATTARNVPATAVYFGTYETLKRKWAPETTTNSNSKPPFFVSLSCGGAAGLSYWLATYPIDVIKSRIQGDATEPSLRRYRGIAHCVRSTYAREGFSAFYRGLVPCLYRAAVCNAFTFAGYETIKSWINGV